MFVAAVAITGIFFSPCFKASEQAGIDMPGGITDDSLKEGVSGVSFSIISCFSKGASPSFPGPVSPGTQEASDYSFSLEERVPLPEPGTGYFRGGLFYRDLPGLLGLGPGFFPEENEIKNAELAYVYLFPDFRTDVLDPYVLVAERDERNHVAAAWVEPEFFGELASMEEVRAVHMGTSPLVRKIRIEGSQPFLPGPEDFRVLDGSTGKGVKIGIISDGVDGLSGVQASGALPPDVHVLTVGEGSEGTAMLEIVHGIAPDAELYFHAAGSNKLEFNKAVDTLLAEGCQVICDDIGWPDEPFFEDGVVASHIRDLLENRNLLYISSAGNDANCHYQGMFFDDGSGWHDFSSGKSSSKNLYVDIPPGGKVTVVLQWNDPWDASGNDYNLYLKDCSSQEELASGKTLQEGKGVPLEFFRYANPGKTARKGMVCIEKYSGDPKLLEVYIYPESSGDVYPDNLVEEDSVFGHPAVPGVLCVGAVDSGIGVSGTLETGIAPYSSRGPVSIYFPHYEVREKTDICGPGSVELKGTDGCGSLFSGTSASAPYVAGIAALTWSMHPEKNASEIREILCSTAGDLGTPGYDNVFGYGTVDASAVLEGQ